MDQEIRFGGGMAIPAVESGIPGLPATLEEYRERYAEVLEKRPLLLKNYERLLRHLQATPEGREKYGDPDRGGTLLQAWRLSFANSGIYFVCLLARGRQSTPTEGIENVVLIAPTDLANTLVRGFAQVERFNCMLFVHDGRSGHCVTVLGHDTKRGVFRYHDSWAGDRSLLCREYNLAGVDAQPAGDGLWEITERELERLVFAVFVWPTWWADLTGQPYRIAYQALRESDFFGFFNLRETARTPSPYIERDGRLAITLQPGGFQENICLQLVLDRAEWVRKGILALRRSWVIGPPFGVDPFAHDFAKGFLDALLPQPDRAAARVILEAIDSLSRKQGFDGLLARADTADLSATERLQRTYLGKPETSSIPFTFCRIEAKNDEQGGAAWLVLEVDLY